MKKTFVRIIGDDEIAIDSQQDFIDDQGNRHPRNVLWLWSDEELWDVLHIKVVWLEEETSELMFEPQQIPLPPEPPDAVLPPDKPLPPAPPAPPAPDPAPLPPPIIAGMLGLETLKSAGIEITDEITEALKEFMHSDAKISTLIAYGGIAFRNLTIAKKGGYHQGHRHNYDHMTNLIKGSVLCEVDGAKPKRFDAPCQITIAADHWHKFTAMTDDVHYQCIYRQMEREDLYTNKNSPYEMAPYTAEELIEKIKLLDNPCAHCDCDNEGSDVQPETDKL